MATFWERADHSVDHTNVCSLCILTICKFSYFPFWFLGLDLGSDYLVPGPLHAIYFSNVVIDHICSSIRNIQRKLSKLCCKTLLLLLFPHSSLQNIQCLLILVKPPCQGIATVSNVSCYHDSD